MITPSVELPIGDDNTLMLLVEMIAALSRGELPHHCSWGDVNYAHRITP